MIQEVSLITVVEYLLKNNHFIIFHIGLKNGNTNVFINYEINPLNEFVF